MKYLLFLLLLPGVCMADPWNRRTQKVDGFNQLVDSYMTVQEKYSDCYEKLLEAQRKELKLPPDPATRERVMVFYEGRTYDQASEMLGIRLFFAIDMMEQCEAIRDGKEYKKKTFSERIGETR